MNEYSEFDHCILGETGELLRVDTSAQLRQASLRMVRQCRRKLELMSRHLDPTLYDTAEFYEALRDLALESRYSQIRIVILDPSPLIAQGHRILGLAQQLSSFIHIRTPAEEHRDLDEAFLIADAMGVIYRRLSDRFEATVNFNDKSQALELQRRFDAIWDKGLPDPNFRRLGL